MHSGTIAIVMPSPRFHLFAGICQGQEPILVRSLLATASTRKPLVERPRAVRHPGLSPTVLRGKCTRSTWASARFPVRRPFYNVLVTGDTRGSGSAGEFDEYVGSLRLGLGGDEI